MLFHSTFIVGLLGSAVSATTYAAFYSDDKCTQDKTGVDFSVDNPGCFAVGNRMYVKYHDANAQCFSLVKSPKASCNCQFDCVEGLSSDGSPVDTCGPVIIPDSTCYYIGQSKSLRFIGGGCPGNTCKESRSLFSSEQPTSRAVSDDDEDFDPDYVGYLADKPGMTAAKIEAQKKNQAAQDALARTSGRVHPRSHGEPGPGYYQLCQDEYCLEGCSIDFRTTNPGCFQGANYKSLNIAGGLTGYRFVVSPSPGCPCQSHCNAVTTSLDCTVLPADITNAKSLRLVNGETCDKDNC